LNIGRSETETTPEEFRIKEVTTNGDSTYEAPNLKNKIESSIHELSSLYEGFIKKKQEQTKIEDE
jgi:hypothetical protein